MATLQACASVGQTALTEAYAEVLRERGVLCGQVLLTRRDVVDRDAYLNARNTLTRLLELGAVPVVNENDTVSVAEFTFGDNDMLGAIVSALVGADLYIILSDVDGLYTANPSVDPTATLIPEVTQVDRSISAVAGDSSSSFGTGGMSSKVRAARGMMAASIPAVICCREAAARRFGRRCGQVRSARFRPPVARHAGGRSPSFGIGACAVVHGTIIARLDRAPPRRSWDMAPPFFPSASLASRAPSRPERS